MTEHIDFEQDVAKNDDEDSLARLTKLAALLLACMHAGASLDAQLEVIESDIRRLVEDDIPSLLKEVGLAEIKLEDGTKISVKEDLQLSLGSREIDPERRARALHWLTAAGLGGIIKTEVAVPFGRNSEEEVVKLREALAEMGYDAGLNEDVHFQTLKSTINAERLRRDAMRLARADQSAPLTDAEAKLMGPIPADIFALRVLNKATLKWAEGVPKPGKIRKRS